MELRSHIGQTLRALKATKGSEAVTVCDGRVQNGAQFVDRIAALSIGLRQLGLQPGERVAIAALNSEWYLEWLLAVPSAGGIIAPLNHRWSVAEASAAIDEIEASVLVVDDQCLVWSSELIAICPSLGRVVYIGSSPCPEDSDYLIDAESIIRSAGLEPELQLLQSPSSVALICFTSGSTGKPKAVSLSHSALLVQSQAKIDVVGYSRKDVYLHTATMCHIGGISSALATVMANGCHIILPKFQPEKLFQCINRHLVSTMIVVPAMINDILSYWQKRPGSKCFPTVATILNGAGSLSSSQLEKVKNIFPASKIMTAYGMTEACSSMTFLLLHDPHSSLREKHLVKDMSEMSTQKENGCLGGVCVGKPGPHVEIRINPQHKERQFKRMSVTSNVTATNNGDPDPSTLPGRNSDGGIVTPRNISFGDNILQNKDLFAAGNVLTRGAHVMDGYWGRPAQTKDTLDTDGWLDTGDVGWMDELGQLWLLGRQKDVIKTGGENVYASEVEAVLGRHPGVLAAACVGIPDARLGEAVAAMVRISDDWKWASGQTPMDGLSAKVISETLLRSHCQQRGLSRYKVPKVILIQEEPFPTTSTGKVKKNDVRAIMTALLERRHSEKDKDSQVSKQSSPSDQTFIRSRL